MESLHSRNSDDLDLHPEQQQILATNPSILSDTSSHETFTEKGTSSGEYDNLEITLANPSIASTDTFYTGRDYLPSENCSLVEYQVLKTSKDNDTPGVSTDEQFRSPTPPHVLRFVAEATDRLETARNRGPWTGEKTSIPCPKCNVIVIPKDSFMLLSSSDFVQDSVKIVYDNTSSRQSFDACEEVVQCEACRNKFRLLERYCSTCELWICQFCTEAHKYFPEISSHHLITDVEFKELYTNIDVCDEKSLQIFKPRYKSKEQLSENVAQNIPTYHNHSDVEKIQEQNEVAAAEAYPVIDRTFMLGQMGNSEKAELDNNLSQLLDEMKASSSGKELKERVNIVMDSLVAVTLQTCFSDGIEEQNKAAATVSD